MEVVGATGLLLKLVVIILGWFLVIGNVYDGGCMVAIWLLWWAFGTMRVGSPWGGLGIIDKLIGLDILFHTQYPCY